MTIAVTSYALIGLKIDVQRLVDDLEKRNCQCAVEITEGKEPKFCPECGKRFRSNGREFRKEVEENEWEEFKLLSKYRIIFPISQQSPQSQDEAFVALRIAECSPHGPDEEQEFAQLPTYKQIQEFKNDLGSLGLWDQKKFGLWATDLWTY